MTTTTDNDPFGSVEPVRGWRAAPDCGRCDDTGRYTEQLNENGGTLSAHCTCKRGRWMSELWRAEKDGLAHPDMPDDNEEPPEDWD